MSSENETGTDRKLTMPTFDPCRSRFLRILVRKVMETFCPGTIDGILKYGFLSFQYFKCWNKVDLNMILHAIFDKNDLSLILRTLQKFPFFWTEKISEFRPEWLGIVIEWHSEVFWHLSIKALYECDDFWQSYLKNKPGPFF